MKHLRTEKNLNDCYLIRDAILRHHGYGDYDEFLKSDYWASIKKKTKLSKYGDNYKKCSHCGSIDDLQLHHINYRWLLHKRELMSLRCLCKKCHSEVHEFANLHNIKISESTDYHRNYKQDGVNMDKQLKDREYSYHFNRLMYKGYEMPKHIEIKEKDQEFIDEFIKPKISLKKLSDLKDNYEKSDRR